MRKENYEKLIACFASDFSLIEKWMRGNGKRRRSADEIYLMYQKIKVSWFAQRDVFPNKGTYKTVRRHFVKNVIAYLSYDYCFWYIIPAELCKELLDKVNQGWISSVYDVTPRVWDGLIDWALEGGYKGPLVHPCYRVQD